MTQRLKKILKIISNVLVIFVMVLAILLVGVRIFGLKVFTVLSPSMEPTYKTGSVIYVKSVEPENLKVNDVITFSISKTTTATHRIVEILPETKGALYFQTKGDANEVKDASPVHEANIIGIPVFTIPYIGYLANIIQNPRSKYISIAIILILLIVVFMLDTLTSDDDKKNET